MPTDPPNPEPRPGRAAQYKASLFKTAQKIHFHGAKTGKPSKLLETFLNEASQALVLEFPDGDA